MFLRTVCAILLALLLLANGSLWASVCELPCTPERSQPGHGTMGETGASTAVHTNHCCCQNRKSDGAFSVHQDAISPDCAEVPCLPFALEESRVSRAVLFDVHATQVTPVPLAWKHSDETPPLILSSPSDISLPAHLCSALRI